MAFDKPNSFVQPAIRIAAAGLGAAVAGPLGGALGGILASALGEPAAQLVRSYAEKFGDESAKKLLDTGTDSLVNRLKKSAPDMEAACRQALRLSLSEIHANVDPEFDDCFENWAVCLNSSEPLDLNEIQPAQIVPADLALPLSRAMERLNAQGAALRQKSISIMAQDGTLSPQLLETIESRLPESFKTHFRALIVTSEYGQAWNEAELAFKDWMGTTVSTIAKQTELLPGVAQELDDVYKHVVAQEKFVQSFSQNYDEALKKIWVAEQKVRELESRNARLAKRINSLQSRLSVTHSIRNAEVPVAGTLAPSGKLAGDNSNADQPEFSAALNDPASLSSKTQQIQNNGEASGEALPPPRIYTGNDSDAYLPQIATALRILAALYRATQRMEKALEAYDEALAAFRKLAKANPDAYLPEVATTLSNLVELYRSNGQMEAAEKYTSDLERILDPNWSASSKSSNNQAAKDLQAPALNQEPTASVAEPGTLEGQASATNDPALKHELQELISRLSTSFQS